MFVDASNTAYAAVAYLRVTDIRTKQVYVDFLLGKAKITSSRPMTIPKLALLAALIGARLVKFLLQSFLLKNINTFLWSDSKCVLKWIKHEKILPQFVSNQVREITQSQGTKFHYVPSKDNPADIGSRGSTFQSLKDLI